MTRELFDEPYGVTATINPEFDLERIFYPCTL